MDDHDRNDVMDIDVVERPAKRFKVRELRIITVIAAYLHNTSTYSINHTKRLSGRCT